MAQSNAAEADTTDTSSTEEATVAGTIQYDTDKLIEITQNNDLIPQPVGFKMLIALPEVNRKTAGGLYIPDERRDKEKVASIVGFVLKQGSDCYLDKKRFPTGPWCKEGDWVVMKAYAGTRLTVQGVEFRIIHDDSVESIVADPTAIARA